MYLGNCFFKELETSAPLSSNCPDQELMVFKLQDHRCTWKAPGVKTATGAAQAQAQPSSSNRSVHTLFMYSRHHKLPV